jgi:hypothetical protein
MKNKHKEEKQDGSWKEKPYANKEIDKTNPMEREHPKLLERSLK